ncbi:MAG: alpha-amylase family protein [Bacteroidota bacterium]
MPTSKIIIYQLLVRLFGNRKTTYKHNGSVSENGVGKFDDINEKALSEIKKLGISHIWFTGVPEHATLSNFTEFGIPLDHPQVVKGIAGSPYAIKDWYDVSPELANNVTNRMAEFEALVKRTKENGMGAIIDFIPNHTARQYSSDAKPDGVIDLGASDNHSRAFDPNNNFYYLPGEAFQTPEDHVPAKLANHTDTEYREEPARVTGNDCFRCQPNINDWYETVKLNYGIDFSNQSKHFDPIPNTWNKMLHILRFWADKGVAGFRCDMAEMVPVEFWQWAIAKVKESHPDTIFIAEIYNPAVYQNYLDLGGFDYLYDKVGLYDQVFSLTRGIGNANGVSALLTQLGTRNDKMLRFMENHDEVRIASRLFAGSPWSAVPGMTLSATLGNGPLMLYFGQEVGEPASGSEGFSGEDGKTTIFDYWGVPEHQKWMNNGKFDGADLSNDILQLRGFYHRLCNTVAKNPAFSEGDTYSLQSCNTGCSWDFDDSKVFCFLRFTKEQRFLVFVNFDRNRRNMEPRIKIPREAWDKMGIDPSRNYKLKDLLRTNQTFRFNGTDTLNMYSVVAGARITISPISAYIFSLEAEEQAA